MTGTPAALDREPVPPARPSGALSQDQVRAAIEQRARELADLAPPLTGEQVVLLRAVFSHQSGGG